MSDRALILASLERLAETGIDITPSIYLRFFADCPEAAPLFASREAQAVQGKMLNELVQTVLDQLDDKPYLPTVLGTMVSDHDSWGATLPMYDAFLQAFAEVLLGTLGETPHSATAAAWQRQLQQVRAQVAAALPS